MTERTAALEANLLALVKIVDDIQSGQATLKALYLELADGLSDLRTIMEQHSIGLAEMDAWLQRHDDRLSQIEGLVT